MPLVVEAGSTVDYTGVWNMRHVRFRSRTGLFGALCASLVVAGFTTGSPASSVTAAPSSIVASGTTMTGASASTASDPDDPCAPGQTGVIYGTNASESVNGTNGDDIICALGGDDAVNGRGGNDIAYGGDGRDSLSGANGDDMLMGGSGDDTLTGGGGQDAAYGDAGKDTITGGDGDDFLNGGADDDAITGGDGSDHLVGDAGDDTLAGQSGDDVIRGDAGNDRADGFSGTDTCSSSETTLRCEQGLDALDPYAGSSAIDPNHSAPPLTFTVDGAYEGLEVTLQTNGGIYPWQVSMRAAREYMGGRLGSHMPGGAFDITVPEDAPAFEGGTLTLPYRDGNLKGFPEEQLRVFWLDPETQMWIPVSDEQVVDTAANTVTTPIHHFSVYAVLSMSAEGWADFFADTPLRCVSGDGAQHRVDAAMLIDSSGSMGWEDPEGLRVDGAKLFVKGMRDRDRAAVVSFEGYAQTRIGLTRLDSQANRDAVDAALEATRYAGGGTDIGAAVAEAISIFQDDTEFSIKVAVLMTDGQSSYDPELTEQAAAAGIEINTVGLGAGVNSALLEGIASGTGGSYQHLSDPEDLPALYAQLAGDLIDDGTDSDGDGITNCVERNGMFTPILSTLYQDADAEFVTTNPDLADSDQDDVENGATRDHLDDGEEMLAYDIADHPELAEEYRFLVDQGLTTYYLMIANPNKSDSDGDGVNDGLELAAGTDPLVRDDQRLGIDGLDLPASTLFQPDIENHAYPAFPFSLQVHDSRIRTQSWNGNPIVWASDDDPEEDVEKYDCFGTPCDAVWDLAYEWSNDSGLLCINMVGFCDNDRAQVREIINEARAAQGIFDEDGAMRGDYVLEQSYLMCVTWSSQAECDAGLRAVGSLSGGNSQQALAQLGAVPIAVPYPGVPGIRINADWARAVATAALAGAAAVTAGATVAELTEVAKECYAQTSLRDLGADMSGYRHPCDYQHIYSPGSDVREAAEHKRDAIRSGRSPVLKYRSQAEQSSAGLRAGWYTNADQACNPTARATAQAARPNDTLQCDEYPYYASTTAGPGASLEFILASDNRMDGTRYGIFARGCPPVSAGVESSRETFLVVPVLTQPTTSVC